MEQYLFKTNEYNDTFLPLANEYGVIIYGAGREARFCIRKILALKTLMRSRKDCDIEILCAVDKKWKTLQQRGINGIKVISPDGLDDFQKEIPIVVTPVADKANIISELTQRGFINLFLFTETVFGNVSAQDYIFSNRGYPEMASQHIGDLFMLRSELCDERSVNCFDAQIEYLFTGDFGRLYKEYQCMRDEPQYFASDIVRLGNNEVLVNVGVFDGKNLEDFIQITQGRFKHIYGIEADPNWTETIYKKTAEFSERFTLFSCAVGSEQGDIEFAFTQKGLCGTALVGKEQGYETITVPMNTIDSLFENELDKPTFITMDIEGSDLDGIIGAENIIRTYKPALAISIYHKLEHTWEIPQLIRKFNPDYNFYMRHHFAGPQDVILYALPY